GGGGGGVGLDDILGQLGGPSAGGGGAVVTGGTGGAADDELEDFMRAVMNDLQETWTELFAADGLTYEPTTLVLFTGSVQTGCGGATSAVGPFYCPADRLAYIDFEFFQDLSSRFGAPGDFAQAYVIAHEVGHHVQNLLGASGGGGRSNEDSIRIELQADCYAGVWANQVFEQGDADLELSDGDIEEGLGAAEAVGDDRIQEQSGVDVNPETWTHGSAEQRTEWFTTGYRSGDPDVCDTSREQVG
ncbi:MAG: neutral zinc metallopeptidase, partial [Actinomycetota bacterium]|nr:neutral zinc metallopeptidase [Actinomycetota bacterium]